MKENEFDIYVRNLMAGAEESVSPDVWKGVEAYRGLTGAEARKKDKARLEVMEHRIAACEERLRRGDARFDDAHSDMTQMLTVLNAMLMHFISGNDHDKLRGVKEQLDRYLAGR